MNFYLCTNVTEEEMNFTKGRLYRVERSNGSLYVNDDDMLNTYSADPDAFVDHMKSIGVHLAPITEGANDDYVKCLTDAGSLKHDTVYRVILSNLDMDAEEPLKNVFEGIEVLMADIDITKEELEYSIKENFDIYEFCGALNFHSILEVRVSSFDQFYNQNHTFEEFEMIRFPAYVPTDEEVDKLVSDMGELLDEYGYAWTDGALRKIVHTFFERKGHLISAFMAHPNYNGNYQIVFSDESYRLDTNKNAGADFVNWVNTAYNAKELLKEKTILNHTWDELEMVKAYHQATMPLVKPVLAGDELYLANYELMEKKRREIDKIDYMIQLFHGEKFTDESMRQKSAYHDLMNIVMHYQLDRVDFDTASRLNKYLPEIRARKEQKTTKVVGKIMAHYGIDKKEKYHKAYAKYCDDINIIKIKRHTILSLNPMDYLTMSFGNSWSSCHTIDRNNRRNRDGDGYHGMYSSGTVSYMLDNVSFVLYTVNCNYDGKTFWEQDKINRCMFHLGNERLVQGRCYPQAEDANSDLYKQFRALVHRTLAEIWNIPNLWILKKSGLRSDIAHKGTNYADYFNYSLCNITTYKFAKDRKEVIPIGATPLCVSCGREHTHGGSIACCTKSYREDGTYFCADCGAVLDEHDLHYINGDYYCDDCCFYCEYHGQYEDGNCYCHVEEYGDICEHAYDYGDFFYCDDCDCYYHGDDRRTVGYDDVVCVHCFEDHYVYVDSCDEYHHEGDVRICDHCNTTVLDIDTTEVEGRGYVCDCCIEEHFVLDDDGNWVLEEDVAEAV